ncbi:MAG: LacI family transcriptional regulator [Robiginitomaculum sp.]|nr:MAG: LacI family transcriptional regulator [Robiginitomaculum sp.]
MTNQKQIASGLGISAATVSNALAGKGRVSKDLADRIAAKATELGYVPSAAGRALKTGRSGILGLVMPDITQPVFPDFAHAVEGEADKCGLGVLIANSRGGEDGQASAIKALIQRGVDGIIVVPHRGTSPIITEVPSVVVSTPSDPNSIVSANHRQGGRLAATALLELGHRHFLLIGDDPLSPVQMDRIDGMAEALTGVGTFEIMWTSRGFPDLVEKHGAGVSAILTVSDLLALRVITEAARLGLRCPDAISVIGFDDLPLAKAVRPTLTSIVPDTAELSRRSVACLNAILSQNGQDVRRSIVDFTIAHRESTGPASPLNRNPTRRKQ